jgi:hypothetical protein
VPVASSLRNGHESANVMRDAGGMRYWHAVVLPPLLLCSITTEYRAPPTTHHSTTSPLTSYLFDSADLSRSLRRRVPAKSPFSRHILASKRFSYLLDPIHTKIFSIQKVFVSFGSRRFSYLLDPPERFSIAAAIYRYPITAR